MGQQPGLPKSQGLLALDSKTLSWAGTWTGASDPVSIHGGLSINFRAGRRRGQKKLGFLNDLVKLSLPIGFILLTFVFLYIIKSFPVLVEPQYFGIDLFQ